jgi:hypothetical protein
MPSNPHQGNYLDIPDANPEGDNIRGSVLVCSRVVYGPSGPVPPIPVPLQISIILETEPDGDADSEETAAVVRLVIQSLFQVCPSSPIEQSEQDTGQWGGV